MSDVRETANRRPATCGDERRSGAETSWEMADDH